MPIVVEGVPELKKALKKFAPDLLKEMNAEIRFALKEVVKDAEAKVPGQAPGNLYNWNDKGRDPVSRVVGRRAFPLYNSGEIRSGLTYSIGRKKANSKGFSSLYSLLNKSPVGAIVETAGTVHPYGRPTSHMVSIGRQGHTMRIATTKDSQSNNPDAGRIFVGAMNDVGPLKRYDRKSRLRGRLLYAAYAENNGKALDATMKAIAKAAATLKSRSTVRRAA